jgi:endonuclease-3
MATTINKQRLLNQLLATARKGADAGGPARPLLQEFIYGLCRENASAEQAEQAYCYLSEHFFDWNEVRVSSPREVEEAFAGLPGSEERAQRLLSFLQEVFEKEFSFDLDGLLKKKRGLKEAAQAVVRYQAANDYVGAWVVQRSLGGHAIPIDAPTLRCCRRLGLVDAGQEDAEAARASLEHLIPKAKGPSFTDQVSKLAEEYCWEEEPNCPACPMAGDCATAQEGALVNLAGARCRPKPR